MNKQFFVVILTNMFCCLFFVSCAQIEVRKPNVKLTPNSMDDEAKLFVPMPNKANIYVFNTNMLNYNFKDSVSPNILLDNQNVGIIDQHNYLLLSVNPGEHTLSFQAFRWIDSDKHASKYVWERNQGPVIQQFQTWFQRPPLTLNTEVGKNYFIQVNWGLWTGAKYFFKIVDNAKEQQAVRNSKRAVSAVDFWPLRIHTPSKPEKLFRFFLITKPLSARIIVEKNGNTQEIGTTPYTFQVGLACEYEYKSIQNEKGEEIQKDYVRSEYKLYVDEPPLLTICDSDLKNPVPEFVLKCTLLADSFEPQSVERVISLKRPISPVNIESWIPEITDIVVGLNKPTQPEYTVKIKIDSVPSGADIYTLDIQGYLGEKLGTTPAEFEVGFANKRFVDTGAGNPSDWALWRPNKEEGFINWSDELPLTTYLNFVLLKDGYARQNITRWAFHTPDIARLKNTQRTITIPLKTPEEVRQERLERIEQARTGLAAALKRTEMELKRAEITNQRDLIRQQELISDYLARLNTTFERISTSSASTIILKNDPHYNREWQDAMQALGSIMRPYSESSPTETEQNIKALEGFGILFDLLE